MNQSNSKEGASSCQCTMTLIGQDEELKKIVLRILSELLSRLEDSRKDIGRLWDLDPRRNAAEPMPTNRMENGIKTAEGRMLNFAESGHPLFRASSALERGELKSKGKGVRTILFNGSDEHIELILRTLVSVNQLSIHGAAADLCKEIARDSSCAGKPAANEYLESMVIPTEFPTANPITQIDAGVQRKLLREY